jgi:CVNH domain
MMKMKGNGLMRCLRVFGLVIGMMVLGHAGGSALAQNTNPPGPYQQSCSDISVKKGNLYAKCQDANGKAHSTKLSGYDQCTAGIVNKNGILECAHADAAAPSQPSGPYMDSCKNIRMKGATLYAVCKSLDGREALTSLRNANTCAQGVINLNGILNCAVSDVLPPGSYLSTCKDIRMKGTTLYASCNNGRDSWINAELHEANRCSGDISNENGTLRCTPFRTMEKR